MTPLLTHVARHTTLALLASASLLLGACSEDAAPSLAQTTESPTTTPAPAPTPTPAPTPAPTPPVAGKVTLTWDVPDSASVSAAGVSVKGYRVYAGTSASTLTPVITVENPTAVSHVVENLAKGTWYFAVSTVTTDGRESELTAPAQKTI